MRIDDMNRFQLDNASLRKRTSHAVPTGGASETAAATPDPSRTERIERLKQAFSQGKPVDVNKLADKMLSTGIFFDEKA